MAIETTVLPATPEAIGKAAKALLEGGLVAFPTETVYGLGGDATNDEAVAAIYAAKNRPDHNPLIVHAADVETAAGLAHYGTRAERLAETFWPGSLTLVLDRDEQAGLSPRLSAGLDTVAVRVPDHVVASKLLTALGRPVAAPSANTSGTLSPTTAGQVAESLAGKVPLILDGGPCMVGIESTIVRISGEEAHLLRPGGIPREAIEDALGVHLSVNGESGGAPIVAPGQLDRHYAPNLPLRLDVNDVRPGEVLLAFGKKTPEGAVIELNLSRDGDLDEAAANLFAMLRTLDHTEAKAIAVMPVPEAGLGAVINDRLRRAAAAQDTDT